MNQPDPNQQFSDPQGMQGQSQGPNQFYDPQQAVTPQIMQQDDQQWQAPQEEDASGGNAPTQSNFGSPESAPIASPESSTAEPTPEYGYEKIQDIEASAEVDNAQPEKGETIPTQPEEKTEPAPTPPVAPVASKPTGPKFFGYPIPQSLTSNLEELKQKRGKGDLVDARTWMVVLLDRFLRKQNPQQ